MWPVTWAQECPGVRAGPTLLSLGPEAPARGVSLAVGTWCPQAGGCGMGVGQGVAGLNSFPQDQVAMGPGLLHLLIHLFADGKLSFAQK